MHSSSIPELGLELLLFTVPSCAIHAEVFHPPKYLYMYSNINVFPTGAFILAIDICDSWWIGWLMI
jgi:hypothetical protein